MRKNGYALITALIFLVVLTLVAVTALRSSGLELRMGSNSAQRTESFESSESPRLIMDKLVEAHAFSGGWPQSMGGTVTDAEFDFPIPTGISLSPNNGATDPAACTPPASTNPPSNWYIDNTRQTACNAHTFDCANTGATRDAAYVRDIASTGQQPLCIRASFSVLKIRRDLTPGAGTQMLAGYEGTGKSSASGGGRIFYYVNSFGKDSTKTTTSAESKTETGTMYRYIIRN